MFAVEGVPMVTERRVKMEWLSVSAGGTVESRARNLSQLLSAGFTARIDGKEPFAYVQVWGDKRTLGQARANLAGTTYTWESHK